MADAGNGRARYSVGRVGDFDLGRMRIMSIADRSIGVVRTSETFYAVLNVCPHELAPVCEGSLTGTMLPCKGGDVEYGLEDRILRCPWHGYEFDLGNDGKAAFSSFHGRVRLFPVVVEDEEVFVEMRRRDRAGERSESVDDR